MESCLSLFDDAPEMRMLTVNQTKIGTMDASSDLMFMYVTFSNSKFTAVQERKH